MNDETHLLHRNLGKNITLAGRTELVVGRLYHEVEILNDDNCSRKHFQLQSDGGGWKITNLSNYGTLLNGRLLALNETVSLAHQDSIQASKQEFVYFETAAPTLPPSSSSVPRLIGKAPLASFEQVPAGKAFAQQLSPTPPSPNQATSTVVSGLSRMMQTIAQEAKMVFSSFTHHVKGLFAASKNAVLQLKLQADVRKTCLALGRRCYETGQLDNATAGTLRENEAKITELKAGNKSTKSLEAEIDKQLVAIGRTKLARQADSQGAHTEYAAAQTAEKALQDHLNQKVPLGGSSQSQDRYYRARIAAAYALIALLLYLPFGMRWTSDTQVTSITQEDKLSKSVGLVVCGLQVKAADGAISDFVFSTGSCFAVNSTGYMLTNKHVVEETWNNMHATLLLERLRKENLVEVIPTVWVFFGGEKFKAEILHVSDKYDMAVLKTARHNTPFFRLADADQYRRGTRVIAAGFPASAQQPLSVEEAVSSQRRRETQKRVELQFKPRDYEFITTDGTISRLTTEEGQARRWIQHNASINPGNSGGPLLLDNAMVIGINTLGQNSSGTYYSLTLPQLKAEIDKYVPDVRWE